MQKLKQYWVIILLVVIILGGLFYWYEWRPMTVRKNCTNQVFKGEWKITGGGGVNGLDMLIKLCLLSDGVKE